jgi:hypothetical protein
MMNRHQKVIVRNKSSNYLLLLKFRFRKIRKNFILNEI